MKGYRPLGLMTSSELALSFITPHLNNRLNGLSSHLGTILRSSLRSPSLRRIKEGLLSEVGGDKRLFEKATLEMEEGNLLTRRGERIVLTPDGRETAEKIYSKHRFIEEYFSKVFKETNVHLLAHALEHCVSDSLLGKMKGELALMSETVNLSELKTG